MGGGRRRVYIAPCCAGGGGGKFRREFLAWGGGLEASVSKESSDSVTSQSRSSRHLATISKSVFLDLIKNIIRCRISIALLLLEHHSLDAWRIYWDRTLNGRLVALLL